VNCIDTLKAADSLTSLVTLSVAAHDARQPLPPEFESLFAQEFRSRLSLPPNLKLAVLVGEGPCDTLKCAAAIPTFGVHLYATAHSNGTLSHVVPVDLSLAPDLTKSVRAALQRLSDEQAAPFAGKADEVPIEIWIRASGDPARGRTAVELFSIQVPHYRLPFTRAAWPPELSGPHYPLLAKIAGTGDSLTMNFVVLPDGRVAPESIDLESAHYRDFAHSVAEYLERTHYVPATIGSCRVATRARQSFQFTMR
jgi:hypothetical protein